MIKLKKVGQKQHIAAKTELVKFAVRPIAYCQGRYFFDVPTMIRETRNGIETIVLR